MDDEYEVEGVGVCYAVEDEHRLHGEMPWAGTVRRWHDDGYGTYDERDHGAHDAEMGGEVEAEEREVIMQEIAEPDGEAVEDEQRHVAHMAQGCYALDDALQRCLYLII